jgi:hypothetical protein
MSQAYVVTEGKRDVELLKRVLPERIVRATEFVPGHGKDSARSLARSILASKRLPVALVVDADTDDEPTIRERESFLDYYLRQAAAGIPFRVFTAIPEIEAVFFEDRAFVEEITKQHFSTGDWEFARRHPKEFLTRSLREGPEGPAVSQAVIETLSGETVRAIQQHPLVRGLTEFLSSVIANGD